MYDGDVRHEPEKPVDRAVGMRRFMIKFMIKFILARRIESLGASSKKELAEHSDAHTTQSVVSLAQNMTKVVSLPSPMTQNSIMYLQFAGNPTNKELIHHS